MQFDFETGGAHTRKHGQTDFILEDFIHNCRKLKPDSIRGDGFNTRFGEGEGFFAEDCIANAANWTQTHFVCGFTTQLRSGLLARSVICRHCLCLGRVLCEDALCIQYSAPDLQDLRPETNCVHRITVTEETDSRKNLLKLL